jgi:hypothetical protein
MRSLRKAAVSLADYLIWNTRPVLWSLYKNRFSPCAAYLRIVIGNLGILIQPVDSAVRSRGRHLQHPVTKPLTALLTGLCLLVAKHHAFTEKANSRSSTRQDVRALLMVTLAARYVHRVGYIRELLCAVFVVLPGDVELRLAEVACRRTYQRVAVA